MPLLTATRHVPIYAGVGLLAGAAAGAALGAVLDVVRRRAPRPAGP
jgi:hypothetical protein